MRLIYRFLQLTATRGALAGSARACQGRRNRLFSCGFHAHTLIMENARRNAYDLAFKLKAIDQAVKKGNKLLHVPLASMNQWWDVGDGSVKNWLNAKRRKKLSEVIKADGLNLKTFLKTGWTHREPTAEVFPPCRSDWKPKQSPPKWTLKMLKVDHRGCYVWAQRTVGCALWSEFYDTVEARNRKYVNGCCRMSVCYCCWLPTMLLPVCNVRCRRTPLTHSKDGHIQITSIVVCVILWIQQWCLRFMRRKGLSIRTRIIFLCTVNVPLQRGHLRLHICFLF